MDIHQLSRLVAGESEVGILDTLHTLEAIVDLCAERKDVYMLVGQLINERSMKIVQETTEAER